MAIQLKELLRFPQQYKDRENSWKELRPIIKNVKRLDDKNILITGGINNYTQTILIFSDKILSSTNVLVECSCKSFQFEFAHALNDVKGLYQPDDFKKSINIHPKEKNIHRIPSGCKHLICLANYIIRYRQKIESLLDR